jgi:hypothetical protein
VARIRVDAARRLLEETDGFRSPPKIQDELFADDVKSIEPADAPARYRYLRRAEGKANVRKKAEEWVSRVEKVSNQYFSAPVEGGKHFALACAGSNVTRSRRSEFTRSGAAFWS